MPPAFGTEGAALLQRWAAGSVRSLRPFMFNEHFLIARPAGSEGRIRDPDGTPAPALRKGRPL